jgi:Signal peptide peptidase
VAHRVPNVKVCTLLLGALFLYDIFWVFISEHIFGSNVMLAAASKQARSTLGAVFGAWFSASCSPGHSLCRSVLGVWEGGVLRIVSVLMVANGSLLLYQDAVFGH